ncbi:MAG: hypothetical protein Q7K71_07045 [Candidatus Omnitrophota bacterium]|nr:hypothetical protein [Candidatus Omnitrophota bacterium]
MRSLPYVFWVLFLPAFVSCATPPRNIQPQINSLVIAQHFDKAVSFLGQNPSAYGSNNELLFWLDRGFVLHLAGRYAESVSAFESAKRKFNDLYTRSISQTAATYAVNDYWQEYRGEDYEYVLVNIFQALNFAAMDNVSEALVEARDMDARSKWTKTDDAFARMLFGILYRAAGTPQDLNDAYIDDVRSKAQYGADVPKILAQNLEAAQTPDVQASAEVYLFHYTGFVPLKVADTFLIPLDASHVTAISFPRYADRVSDVRSSVFSAVGPAVGPAVGGAGSRSAQENTEPVEDIGAIAKKILNDRKAFILAKAGLRPIGKYLLEKAVESRVRDRNGETPAEIVNLFANVYNLYSEQADVRGWQTLPEKIRAARLLLEPGRYEFFVEDLDEKGVSLGKKPLGVFDLQAGRKKFFIVRSYR